jgi:hypothetical protein
MLKRLVILNSTTYGKAVISFDDADSIQLVGPNNIGKSTLVFTLNFLFIIDGKKMTFVDNKTGDKDTIHHYFPSASNSYIVFEIFKQRYYSIILKRNHEGELEYYKIESEYKEELFIKNENQQQTILKFEALEEKLISSGLTLYSFKDKREVFNFVYQRSKRNNAVVWLEDSVVSDGLSNNFSKIYRYLINSKLITNKTLKEALIIADNRDKESINFSQKSKKDINDLLRINNEIKSIYSIQKDFYEFREILNQFKARSKNLSEFVFAFNSLYSPTLVEVETSYFKKKKELEDTQLELNEHLTPQKQKLDREIGGLDVELGNIISSQESLKNKIIKIKGYEGSPFLTQELLNLEPKRRALEASITRVERYSAAQIKVKIQELTQTVATLTNQINGYEQQLIHKISDKKEIREFLNAILSKDVTSSNAHTILQKVSEVKPLLNLFDGKINLSGINAKTVTSLDDLKVRLASASIDLEDFEKLLPVAVNAEAALQDLENLNLTIAEVKLKITEIESMPVLEKQLNEEKELFTKLTNTKDKAERQLATLKETIVRMTESIPIITKARDGFDKRADDLRGWKAEIEKIGIEPTSWETAEGINHVYSRIQQISLDRNELKIKKDRYFDNIKFKIQSNESDEDVLIKFIEDEIACLADKQKGVDTILQAISTQFANPAYTLLKRYGEFKEFINNKFNAKISKTKISDIESLKIVLNDNIKAIDELKKISSIQEFTSQINFDFDQSENLKTLKHFLDSGKKIDFDELFDIELHLTKNGKEKKVDLREQVESTGTDIMVRMVIIMSVINKLVHSDKRNKITIAIDEIARVDGKNRLELFKFCKEHNFIPVCTSTEETMLDGFDKYVMVFRPSKGKKVIINESQPNVILQQSLDVNERD